MNPTLRLIASLVCAVALTACGGVPDDTNKVVIDPTTQPVGYSSVDLAVGSGSDVVASGDRVTVSYTGWLYQSTAADYKGTQFETSTTPFLFTVGTGTVIAGWEQGVIGMKVGGTRRLVLPASLAYGANIRYAADGKTVVIPANSGLVFDLTLTTLAKP